MKKDENQPMLMQDIEKILAEASRISNHRRFVIAGSLCAIGAVMSAPVEMTMSRDLDMYPQLDPGRRFIEIAKQLGEGSVFHQENGFYADPITPALLALAEGWESRLAPISMPSGVVAFFMEPNDAALGKLIRGNPNDLQWIGAGLREGVLNADVIIQRLRQAPSVTHEESQKAISDLRLLMESTSDGECSSDAVVQDRQSP